MKPPRLEALTPEAFAPYGDVIQTQGASHYTINDGMAVRFNDLARVDPGPDGRAMVNIFRGQPFAWPVPLSLLERHPLGSQAFVPLGGRPYLVVVALGTDAPDPATLRAFLAQGSQGVNYQRGVWHHPLLALEVVSDFLVIDRGGEGANCDVFALPQGLLVEREERTDAQLERVQTTCGSSLSCKNARLHVSGA